jgi:hypothetical protein
VITMRDAAAFSALSSSNGKPTSVGNTYMFCELDAVKLCCTEEQVVSVKPFRMEQLAQTCGKWSETSLPGRGLIGWILPSD